MDYDTGQYLYVKDHEKMVPPASMSKLMTVNMIFEKLKDGSLSLDDTFTVSERAWKLGGAASGGSTMFLKIGEKVRVEDILKGILIQSGNDACIVAAENLAGSEDDFAEMMNKEETDVLCFQEYRGNGDFTEQDLQNTYAKIFPYSFIPEGLSQAIYSRYPIRQSQTIEFPNTNNGAIWADLDVKGMTIRIINVHMQTTSFDRMRSKAAQARGEQDEEQERGIYLGYSDNFRENTVRRAGQAEQISSLINATEYPLIVCGDFNDPPGTFTYETLKNGLKDGFQTAGEGYGATYRGFHHLLRIDYLFHSTLLEGIKYKVIPYDMSDHNPVYLEVGL